MAVKQYRAWNPTAKEYVYWFAGEDIPSGIQGDTIVVVDDNCPSGEIPNEIEKINYLPDDESSASDAYTSIVAAVNEGKLPLLIIGDERNGNYLPMSKASSDGYKFSFVGDDGIHTYIAANGTITYNLTEISSQELTAESPINIEGDVIKVDTVELKVKSPLTFNEDTMEIALDPALCTINVDAITDWIDITDEWEFINKFRLYYAGQAPGPGNEMTILYSPKYNYVKFTGSMRINRSSPLDTTTWNVFLRYNGDRFYTTDNTIDSELFPRLGVISQIGGQLFIPGSDNDGTSTRSILKLAYVGNPSNNREKNGLGVQVLYNYSGSLYGLISTYLIMKVTPKW